MLQTIIFEKDGGVARITLNRPDVLNAVNEQMLVEMNSALDEIEKDPEIQVVVITGKGRAFSAGADLKEIREIPYEKQSEWRRALGRRVYNRIENLPQPVIAAINGFALAGGLELAMCCDLIIASDAAQIGDQHANYGLAPGGWGSSQRLPRLIGIRKAKEFLFTGDRIPVEEAARLGLINKVVPSDKLEAAVTEMVNKLLTKSAVALRAVKVMVNRGIEADLGTGLEIEKYVGLTVRSSQEFKNGVAAFGEKKKTLS